MRHMHGRFRRGFGFGPGYGFRRFPNREQLIERLEEYQRDLEQEAADVADIIRRLKDERDEQPRDVALA